MGRRNAAPGPVVRGYDLVVRRLDRRWVEPVLVGVLSVALVTAFWAAWKQTDTSPSAVHGAARVSPGGASAPRPASSPAPTRTADPAGIRRAEKARMRALAENSVAIAAHQRTLQPISFVLGSYNILSSWHTAPGRDAARYGSWVGRADATVAYIRARGFGVLGLEEVQPDQYGRILGGLSGSFAAYPGLSVGGRDMHTQLLWRTDQWRLVEGHLIRIPFMAWTQTVPYGLLENRQTGRRIWVMVAHNAPEGLAGQRAVALSRELAVAKQLIATSYPTFLVGDWNEHLPTFCRVVDTTGLISPQGGSRAGQGCRLPPGSRLDMIFGPADAHYSGFVMDRSALVARSTDHHVPSVQVTLG